MMTAETVDAERAQWIANLDTIAALEPTFFVAGHKKVANDNDPKIIVESQQYLRDFSASVVEETTDAGIVSRMVQRYPGWENLRTLWYSARNGRRTQEHLAAPYCRALALARRCWSVRYRRSHRAHFHSGEVEEGIVSDVR